LPEQTLRVPLPIFLALNGQDGHWPGAEIGGGDLQAVPLPDSIKSAAHRHAAAIATAGAGVLVLRTASAVEGRAVADCIARRLDRRPVFLEPNNFAGLAPWLLLRGLLPVLL